MDLIADVKNLRNLGIATSILILFSAFTSLNLAIDGSPPAFIPASSSIFTQEFLVSWTKGYADLRELSEEANVILKGKVVASRLYLPGSILGGILFTEHVLSVEEVLKGDVPSHSYTKQFLQILESKMRGSSSVQGKQTSGTVEGIPDSTYNGLTDMMRCDAQQNDATYGVVVGTGTGAESNNDYKLGTIIANGQAAGQLVYGPVSLVAPDINGSYVDFVISRSYYNGSGNNITAYEFGVYVKVGPRRLKSTA